MQPVSVHRVVGEGPGVVCLGSTGAGELPWLPLAERLAPQWRVVLASMPDGAPPGRSFADELEALRPAFDAAGERFHLVGHSWGGALALHAALAWPGRVESVSVYEPLLPAPGVVQQQPDPLAELVARTFDAVARGEVTMAARGFVDFWAQPGAFDGLPVDRRDAVAAAIGAIDRWRHALLREFSPADFAGLRTPVLHMAGRPGELPVRSIDLVRCPAIAGAHEVRFLGLGHLGPLTDPQRVNAVVESFLVTRRAARSGAASLLLGTDPSDGALIARWGLDGAPGEAAVRPASGASGTSRFVGRSRWPPSSDPGARDQQPFRSPPV